MPKRDWWNKEFRILTTLGDSITAGGWASCRQRCWASLLARMISDYQRQPVQLINMGIGANLISTRSPRYALSGKPAADERLDQHVLGHMANGNLLLPDLLVIALAVNDARGDTPIGLYREELVKIIDRVRRKIQPLIVLLGPYHIVDYNLGAPDWCHADPRTFALYNDTIRSVADQRQCLFADVLQAMGEADWLVHRDGVHTNDLGHRVVANRIFEVLAANCSGLALETKALEPDIVPWRDEGALQEHWKPG